MLSLLFQRCHVKDKLLVGVQNDTNAVMHWKWLVVRTKQELRCVSFTSQTLNSPKAFSAYDCPIPPTSRNLYTDFFARTRAFPFIAATNTRDQKEVITVIIEPKVF